MNRRLDSKLRQIETMLERIINPATSMRNINGQDRTILPNAKVREAKQLYEKIAEAELLLINTITDQEEFQEYQRRLNEAEKMRQIIICPEAYIEAWIQA